MKANTQMTSPARRLSDRGMNPVLAAAPIAAVQLDFSAIEAFCAAQREAGVADILPILAAPGRLGDLLGKIVVTSVNNAVLRDLGSERSEDLEGPFGVELRRYLSPTALVDQVCAVFDGRRHVRSESEGTDGMGQTAWHVLNWSAGSVDGVPDYSDALIIAEDTTGLHAGRSQQSAHQEQLQALIEIGSQLTTMLEPDVIFAKVLQTIEESLHPARAILVLLDPVQKRVVECSGSAEFDVTYDLVVTGLGGRAMDAGVALITDDLAAESGFSEPARSWAAEQAGWSQIAAPIISGGSPIGVVLIDFDPDRTKPTAESASLIATLAQQAAVAIKNAEMYGELATSHRELQETHDQLKRAQSQLLSAQKMEAIGSLAAGIAHEINTPVQYVSDNISFLKDSSQAVGRLLHKTGKLMAEVAERGADDIVAKYEEVLEEVDFEFIVEEVPDAFEQTAEGVERVAAIVRAMKEFAHPGNDEKAPVDLNRCIATTVEVAKNEWKYVADVDLQLDPQLPEVPALTGPFNQTILILIVNAAQALAERGGRGPANKGTITIKTAIDGDHAVISVTDNGPGIPPEIADQIFDPFFTTKDVGKGSGQGLSIAHSVIVDRHDGTIHAESEVGHGARFIVRLPL